MQKADAWIAGEAVSTSDTVPDLDPSTGEFLADVSACGQQEVNEAISAARAASTRYRKASAVTRAQLLMAMASLIRRDAERLADLETSDVGKPISQSRADVEVCAKYFDFYAAAIQALSGEVLPQMDGVLAYTRREPFGVTGHITPWNYPLQMTARTVAPSLAAGNCVVLKPAEDAPLTSIELGKLASEAGFAPGVFNVVPGLGHVAGAALSGHRGIDHISFTGSRVVGTVIAEAAARNVIPAVLELGGKSPHVVFEDADVDQVATTIVRVILQNAGQTCSAGSRVLVHESISDRLAEVIARGLSAASVGPGSEDPDLGPLISAKQRGRVLDLVDQGRGEARLVTGGSVIDRPGFYFEPTLFTDVPADSMIGTQEVFGPVLTLASFADDDAALTLANGTDYGLTAAIWTRDISRAHRMAEDVCAGQVFINTYGAGGGVELPFGGWKRSGYGREKGLEGLLGYLQTKTVAVGL